MAAAEIKHVIRRREAGDSAASIATSLRVTPRHVRRICARHRQSGKDHVLQRAGRKPSPPTDAEVQAVLKAHAAGPVGVARTSMNVRDAGHIISDRRTYRIMKDNGLVVPSAAKSKRRKWIRYERKYSNAMWHTDWHEMKDGRFRGFKLVTYLDDASRCVTGAALFKEATSENEVAVLRYAVGKFGAPATILSDNGSCFVGGGGRRKGGRKAPKGSWTPTSFEAELMDRGIELINSRPYHPQTNGKLERFHGSVEAEIFHYESLSAYVEYYNERRLHFALDMAGRQTPLRAFSDKEATKAIRKNDPQWMERDLND